MPMVGRAIEEGYSMITDNGYASPANNGHVAEDFGRLTWDDLSH